MCDFYEVCGSSSPHGAHGASILQTCSTQLEDNSCKTDNSYKSRLQQEYKFRVFYLHFAYRTAPGRVARHVHHKKYTPFFCNESLVSSTTKCLL